MLTIYANIIIKDNLSACSDSSFAFWPSPSVPSGNGTTDKEIELHLYQ